MFLTEGLNLDNQNTAYVDGNDIDLTEAVEINAELETSYANLREETILTESQAYIRTLQENEGVLTESATEALEESTKESVKNFFKKAWAMIQKAWAETKKFFSKIWNKITGMVQSDRKWLEKNKLALENFEAPEKDIEVKVYPAVAGGDIKVVQQVSAGVEKVANQDLKSGLKINNYKQQINRYVAEMVGDKSIGAFGDVSVGELVNATLGGEPTKTKVTGSLVKNVLGNIDNVMKASDNVKTLNKLVASSEKEALGFVKAQEKVLVDGAEGDDKKEAKKEAKENIELAKKHTSNVNKILSVTTKSVNKFRSHSMKVLKAAANA